MESSYLLIITLLIFGVSQVLCAPKPGLKRSEIVGGVKAELGAIPYVVSIQVNDYHWCGGSIIEPDIILTAAHCTYDNTPEELSVRAGSLERGDGGQVVNVKNISQHKGFDMEKFDFDVALLKLEEPLNYTKFVKPIKLIEDHKFLSKSKPKGVISGWGLTKQKGRLANVLMVATVPILPKTKCKDILEPELLKSELKKVKFTENMLCAGYKEKKIDACQADSGGPLVVNRKQAGIVSWGIGCAKKGVPGIYADVVQLRPWIDQHLRELKQQA